MKIVCVIPAYNEEKNITKVVSDVMPYADEVVVVDDYSRDNTSALAAGAGATVLRHIINRGQGAALQTGNEYALKNGADIIVHFDADDQFLAKEIPDMVKPIIEGRADIVFGSRFLGKETNFPFSKKYIIMPLAQFFSRVFLGVKLSDPQNGFRALSRSAAENIIIDNRQMAHASEIQVKAFKQKLKIAEVPITVIYHHFGQKLSGGFIVIRDLIISKIIK
ncbi:MAG: glycosyltransferase family 2 protein [Patescibacteria group bacterium]